MVGFFLGEEEIDYLIFFWSDQIPFIKIYLKMTFLRFQRFFQATPKFWTDFSDKSLLSGNLLEPIERST